MAAILTRYKDIRGTLLDRPDVLPDADNFFEKHDVRSRCDLAGGSFFDPINATGEVWILSQILHDWPDSDACRILTSCRKRRRPEDRLLVIKMVPTPCRPDPALAIIDIGMMTFGGEARQRTAAEYEQLFATTNFRLTRVLPTKTNFSIIEGRPVDTTS